MMMKIEQFNVCNYGKVCISTQIGCNMGCVFCESGRLKKVEI